MQNSPRPDTTKLEAYYKHASENSGKDQFYLFLYRYVDVIVNDKTLYAGAMRFWVESLVADLQKDDKKSEQFIEKVTALANKPELYQSLDFFLSTFKLIDETKIKETKPYYCWYQLYNCFYGLHNSIISAENIRNIKNLDFDNPKVKALLSEAKASEKDIKAFKTFDFDMLADIVDRETQSVIPTKSKLRRDDYESCLTIFHADFMKWLAENNVDSTSNQVEVVLSFEDIYPYVTNRQTNEKYKFSRINTENRPYKIIKWCLDNADGKFATSSMLAKHISLGKNGLIDDLHKSVFNVVKGDLRFFISNSEPNEITVSSRVLLKPSEIEELKSKAKIIPISE